MAPSVARGRHSLKLQLVRKSPGRSMASILSVGFCGRTMRRVSSVGSTLPELGRWKSPYLIAELISTETLPLHPTLAYFAASRSVHSLPALFSRTACGILKHFRMGCLG